MYISCHETYCHAMPWCMYMYMYMYTHVSCQPMPMSTMSILDHSPGTTVSYVLVCSSYIVVDMYIISCTLVASGSPSLRNPVATLENTPSCD